MSNNILQYQTLDQELFKMEKELKNNDYRKQGMKLTAKKQEAEATLTKLDTRTVELKSMLANSIAQLDEVSKVLEEHQKAVQDIEDIDELKYLRKKISAQLDTLESCEKNIKNIIKESEEAQGKYNTYASNLPKLVGELATCNEKFAKAMETAKPIIMQLKKQQSELESNMDNKVLTKYKELRAQNIFPVFVPLEGATCGGCRMELTGGAVSQLDTSDSIICEHCHRIIYKSK